MKQGRGTRCTTYYDAIILQWSHGKYTKTIPITKQTRNVGIITTTPGIHNYNKAYQTALSLFPALAFPTTIDFNIVMDDEASTTSIEHPKDQPTKTTKNSELLKENGHEHKEGEKDTTNNTGEPIKVAVSIHVYSEHSSSILKET